MKILFFGSSEFSIPFLEKLCQSSHEIVLVLTGADKQQGRGKKIQPNPVKKFAAKLGLNYMDTDGFNDRVNSAISKLEFDYLVVVSFGKIIPDNILALAGEKTINVHPSILPKYRGPSPISSAILNGDKKTGVTLTKIKKKFDTGDIYFVLSFTISGNDNKDSIEEKVIKLSAPLLVSLLDLLQKNEFKTYPQSKYGVSYTKIFKRNDFKIEWFATSPEIANKVRAFSTEPGSYTTWKGKVIKILSAKTTGINDLKELQKIPSVNGQIVKADRDGLIVKCARDLRPGKSVNINFLQVIELKPEGKNKMTYMDFINGYRIKPGELFE